jgi:predicted ATPase/signal transduction histidine kinase
VVSGLAFHSEENECALVLEDGRGSSLRQRGIAGKLPLSDFLSLASSLVALLDGVHARGVIHGDFHIGNVLTSAATGSLLLLDFCNASLQHARDSTAPLVSRRRLDGNLAYFSPEQTGRFPRPVDHRSDYYSLGVTLFELLTGSLPFPFTDPLELFHAQLARKAPHPSELVAGIPDEVANFVLRLMAKEPNERFLDAGSLKAALFDCGERSKPVSLSVPLSAMRRVRPARREHTLHGRTNEARRLEELFSLACEGEAVFVSVGGSAGVGKSALVRRLIRPVFARNGLFVAGKFEQYGGSSPHSGLTRALESLSQQVLSYHPSELARVRGELVAELAGMGDALLELCPPLTSLIGPQPKSPLLPARETRARLQRVLSSFFRAIADPGRPICLFLDDVHWASADSIALVSHLAATGKKQSLLVVIALRDEPFAGNEALRAAVADLEAQLVKTEHLTLAPLDPAQVHKLVEETISLDVEQARELATITWLRTQGNPYFVHAFLESLLSDGLIGTSRGQSWADLEKIRQRSVTENVVNLLIERINRLPPVTQETLKVAACIGGIFALDWLLLRDRAASISDLWPAVEEQLVVQVGGASAPCYMFTHDRVQQAALGMLTSGEREATHLLLGRRLWNGCTSEELGERIFEVVRHLNAGVAGMTEPGEREELAALNLRAARQAMEKAAGSQALALGRAGLRALGASGWREHYELSRALHLLSAEAAFAWAEHDVLAELAREMVENARDPIDAAKVRRLEGRLYQAQSRSAAAADTYVTALATLGVDLPREPTEEQSGVEVQATANAIGERTLEQIVNLPECEDDASAIAMELLGKLIFFAYSSGSRLFNIAVCRLVRLSLERGVVADTANALTFYGLLLSREYDHERGEEFGRTALALAHRFAQPSVLSQTYLYVHYQLMHWRTPLRRLLAPLRKAYEFGLAAGSPLNAGCSATTLCICRFWAGDELEQLEADMEEYRRVIIQFRQALVQNWHEVLQQTVQNLRRPSADPTALVGSVYVEAERFPVHRSKNDSSALFNYHVNKSLLCYLFGDYEGAARHAERTASFPTIRSAIWALPVLFLEALSRLAVCDRQGAVARQRHLAEVEKVLELLTRLEASNPNTVRHKKLAILAQLAQVQGDHPHARALYAEAADLAAVNGSPLEEGLSCELAARYSSRVGDRPSCYFYVHQARRAYARWGAFAKVDKLESEFAELGPPSSKTFGHPRSLRPELDELDLITVLNTAQMFAREIKLEPLLKRTMSTVVEVAGAQVGTLLTRQGEHWLVEQHVSEAATEPVPEGSNPPVGVVNYVAETGETLLLEDASHDMRLGHEACRAKRTVLSLLCFPLRHRGEITGIVYLENNLLRGAFTVHNARLLELIAAQAVVAIENARIYAVLEREVDARTRQLQERNEELAHAVQRLVQLQGQLVSSEKLAALGSLTAGIAHEIKNPLNFVVNLAKDSSSLLDDLVEIVARIPSPEQLASEVAKPAAELRAAVNMIAHYGTRASDIVSSMALHARDGGGRRERTFVNRVLAQSVTLAGQAFRAAGEFDLSIATDFDARVGQLDMVVEDMSRVFLNLITNARHALVEKRRRIGDRFTPQILVMTRDTGDSVQITVRDNGIGMSVDLISKIFEPFFTTKASGQGTGLGLSISRDIVRAHGGEIRVESVENEFTEFTLVIGKAAHDDARAESTRAVALFRR